MSLLRMITIGSVTIRSVVTDALATDTAYAAGGRSARGKTLEIMTVIVILGSVTRKTERKSKKNVIVAFHSLWRRSVAEPSATVALRIFHPLQ